MSPVSCSVDAFVVLTFTFTYIPNMVKKHVNIKLSERIIAPIVRVFTFTRFRAGFGSGPACGPERQ